MQIHLAAATAMPYDQRVHTVCETKTFERAAAEAGMSREDVASVIEVIATTPDSGDMIPGTGGCRKVRFGRPGRGKSGGYRIITFFTGPNLPVFLITVFAKGEKANLTKRECNDLAILSAALVAHYRERLDPFGAIR